MFRQVILCISLLLLSAVPGYSADLYKVQVRSEPEAEMLNESGGDAVIRLHKTYLMLAEPQVGKFLAEHNFRLEMIVGGITRPELAVDIGHVRGGIDPYPVIYEEDDLRIVRIDPQISAAELETFSLMRVGNERLVFEYAAVSEAQPLISGRVEGVQELIAMVNEDSLTAYTGRLQAFDGRVTGTDSNYAAALWAAGKFVEFGYDSVVVDSFMASSYLCRNVMAYKIGTRLPEHYIVIGAHYDAIEESPGADDNASGSAAVMEMARVVRNVDTDLTLVFILFDGEEQGLFGSSHYAGEASDRGDSIIYMMNLDMIAHYTNSDHANLYDCYDHTFSLLWQALADSLAGISGVLAGYSGSSDHFPFYLHGYLVTFIHEYEHSDVLHSPQDSTTYLNFEYMTRMTRASLATIYWAAQSYLPPPSLAFDYPDGLPMALVPEEATAFEVVIDSLYDGVPVPATGKIHYTVNDGATQTMAMTIISDNHYLAELPALNCGDSLRFCFSAEEEAEGIIYDPDPSEPYRAFAATAETVVFFDDFESERGWMVSGGLWERGQPTGGGGEAGGPDPVGGYNSPSVFGYNLSGDYTHNMPERSITCQPMNCSGMMGVKLSFYRWLGVELPENDHASVRVSRNGIQWTTIWQNLEEVADASWVYQEFDLSSIADNQPVVYLRFTMGTTDDRTAYCGWNIDDLTVTAFICEEGPAPLEIATGSIPDWTAGCQFIEQLSAAGGVGQYTWCDKYGDLAGSGLSLSTDGLVSGAPYAPGEVSFTAVVTDEEYGAAEKGFSFSINDSLIIITSFLPAVMVDSAYHEQLLSSGGTDNIIWSDRYGDLTETGLNLNSDGLLIGTPVLIGSLHFTAVAGDAVECTAEKTYDLEVLAPVECGDANGDGDTNVGDAVYIINYVFKGGPAPVPLCAGDSNGDGDTNVGDAVHLINYVFKGGPPPAADCCL